MIAQLIRRLRRRRRPAVVLVVDVDCSPAVAQLRSAQRSLERLQRG